MKLHALDLHRRASELQGQVFGRRPRGERYPDRRRFVGCLDLTCHGQHGRYMYADVKRYKATNKLVKMGQSDLYIYIYNEEHFVSRYTISLLHTRSVSRV